MIKTVVHHVTVSTGDRSSRTFGYFVSKVLGTSLAKGNGWYGGDGFCHGSDDAVTFDHNGEKFSFLLSNRITIIKNKEDMIAKTLSDKRAKAIAKLSKEDMIALGIT